MFPKLFPQLSDKSWRVFNLNYLSTLFYPADQYPEKNPLLDPAFFERWLHRMHQLFYADYSFGGYREDRRHLWRGTYLTQFHQPNYHDPDSGLNTLHLGVDFNVPPETVVHNPREGTVVHVLADTDREIGWGGRVIIEYVRTENEAWNLIFGHLSHESLPKVGDKIGAGEPLGTVGNYPENGNTFPHLHVQQWHRPTQEEPPDFAALDGYGPLSIDQSRCFPQPVLLY